MNFSLVGVKGPLVPVLFPAHAALHLLFGCVQVHHSTVATRVRLGQAHFTAHQAPVPLMQLFNHGLYVFCNKKIFMYASNMYCQSAEKKGGRKGRYTITS